MQPPEKPAGYKKKQAHYYDSNSTRRKDRENGAYQNKEVRTINYIAREDLEVLYQHATIFSNSDSYVSQELGQKTQADSQSAKLGNYLMYIINKMNGVDASATLEKAKQSIPDIKKEFKKSSLSPTKNTRGSVTMSDANYRTLGRFAGLQGTTMAKACILLDKYACLRQDKGDENFSFLAQRQKQPTIHFAPVIQSSTDYTMQSSSMTASYPLNDSPLTIAPNLILLPLGPPPPNYTMQSSSTAIYPPTDLPIFEAEFTANYPSNDSPLTIATNLKFHPSLQGQETIDSQMSQLGPAPSDYTVQSSSTAIYPPTDLPMFEAQSTASYQSNDSPLTIAPNLTFNSSLQKQETIGSQISQLGLPPSDYTMQSSSTNTPQAESIPITINTPYTWKSLRGTNTQHLEFSGSVSFPQDGNTQYIRVGQLYEAPISKQDHAYFCSCGLKGKHIAVKINPSNGLSTLSLITTPQHSQAQQRYSGVTSNIRQ